MARRHATVLSSLTFALALGACGGGGTDGEVVDPAATVEETAATAESNAEAAVEATETAASEAVDATGDAVDDAAGAVAEAAGDGWEAMQGDWDNSAGLVKDRWSELTEEEILATGGDREQLVLLVQERYNKDREAAEQEVNDWAGSL